MQGLSRKVSTRSRVSIHRIGPEKVAESFAQHVRNGLSRNPMALSCEYLYDEEGSRIFEEICEVPEYYPTRTEAAILGESASNMVAGWAEPPVVIELGSGSSSKTRYLLEAVLEQYGSCHYVPIDISPTILEDSARRLAAHYPNLRVSGFAGDYRAGLAEVSRTIEGPKLLIFLGSSLGNYTHASARDLLRLMAQACGPEGKLLLGTDLVKDRSTLEVAYDDPGGVTARFNLNLLARINRELGGDFDLSQFRHRARYNADMERVEMHLVCQSRQDVQIPGANFRRILEPGDEIHTENSHKYTRQTLKKLALESGFQEEGDWTDSRAWFRVQRWRVHA